MKSPRRAYFIAIGGTGMGSLAGLLKARGVDVSGSDAGLYPPMSTALERWQIPVNGGFSAGNLAEIDPERAQIVEMRFFGGMSIKDVAAATGKS